METTESYDSWFEYLDLKSLRWLPVNDTIVMLGTVAESVSVHPLYQESLPTEVAGAERLRELAAQLQRAQAEAANKDIVKVAALQQLHKESVVTLKVFGHFAIIRAIKHNDPSYMEHLGLPLKKRNSSNRATYHGAIGAPTSLSVKHGPDSGSVVLKVAKVQWAAHYDIELCQGDPTNEESWIHAGTFVNTRNMRIDGLEPGKIYMFRVRCLGPNGFGPYSTIVKIMVI